MNLPRTLALWIACALAGLGQTVPPATAEPAGLSAETQAALEQQWGVRIHSLRLTAAGHMIDLRMRVFDAEKAGPLFRRQTKPYLINQATGGKYDVAGPAKIGPLRTSNPPLAGNVYATIFVNPGKSVKPGGKVTAIIGDFKVEDLVVE
jgi:hypothetical protein